MSEDTNLAERWHKRDIAALQKLHRKKWQAAFFLGAFAGIAGSLFVYLERVLQAIEKFR